MSKLLEKCPRSPLTNPAYLPLGRITVSVNFFKAVQDNFPGLKKHPGYPDLFWYLLFGSWYDEQTERLLLPSELLSEIEGRSAQNSQGEKFLIQFKTDVLPIGTRFEWTKWNKPEGKCRQLKVLDLGAFESVLRAEHEKRWYCSGRVYLDGSVFTLAKQRQKRRDEQSQAESKAALCDDAEMIQRYLNALPPNLFTRAIAENHSTGLNLALTLSNPIVQREQLRVLRCIESQPQPFYAPSPAGNTVRLFTSSAIPNLKREVRHALTAGWSDADLRCSQLAICAHLWKVEDIEKILESGVNFWTHLFDEMAVPTVMREHIKPVIKKAVYSTCYGMRTRYLNRRIGKLLDKAGLDRIYASRFLSVPFIQSLLCAREVALAQIQKAGGIFTPYGKWCAVGNGRKARGTMAEVAQAWEMKLIAPAFELARTTKDFTIALYQFDGFSVHFTRREESWKQRITESVTTVIEEYKLLTNLEWS